MSKTTRKNKPISKVITYQQRDVVKSLTVDGASDLMDLSTDKGHVTLILNRDSTKLNVATFTAYKKETESRFLSIENSTDNLSNQINQLYNSFSEQIMSLDNKVTQLEKQINELKK